MSLNLMSEQPEPHLPDFADTLDLDFEAIFADAVQDIVSTHSPRLALTPVALQVRERRSTRAATAPRPVRKLRSLNLEPLFFDLTPLKLEEKPAALSVPEDLAPEDLDPAQPPLAIAPAQEAKTPPRHLRLVRVEPAQLPTLEDVAPLTLAPVIPLPLPTVAHQPTLEEPACEQPATTQPELDLDLDVDAAFATVTQPQVTHLITESEPIPTDLAPVESIPVESIPVAALQPEIEAPVVPQPQLVPLQPAYSEEVASQLERLHPLIGEMITQDNNLAEQHKQLQTTLQGMFSALITADAANLSDSLPAARNLKLQLQGCQKTLRQQRQTLQQLYTACYRVQMQPLGDLLYPLVEFGQQLAHNPATAQPITFQIAGANTLVEQRMLAKLQQPLLDLFTKLVQSQPEGETGSVQSIGAAKSIAIWGYAWSQQIWLELRFANNPNLFTAELAEFSQQIQALHGTIRQTRLATGETALTMRLPQFLNIAQVLLLKVEQQLLALPLNTLTQVVTVPAQSLQHQQGQLFWETNLQLSANGEMAAELMAQPGTPNFSYAEQVRVPVYSLKQCLAAQSPHIADFQPSENENVILLCVGFADRQVAFWVDELVTEHEVAVRAVSTASQAHAPAYICGYGLLSEEKLVPIIDPAPLLEQIAA